MSEPTKLRIVRPRAGIKGGITCTRCGHERFKFMKTCPRCDDQVLRELDTSTKDLKMAAWLTHIVWLGVLGRMAFSA